ncbi:unnamed protein product [Prorocentrum cordatum]|uniref:Uncharacterized protein n=1 Tax=Prorocentrum cordatum TaxID=2364126 RepID=A0ABN9VWA5_9DINO|nr:unnamed protein product [Polarella glacialis]
MAKGCAAMDTDSYCPKSLRIPPENTCRTVRGIHVIVRNTVALWQCRACRSRRPAPSACGASVCSADVRPQAMAKQAEKNWRPNAAAARSSCAWGRCPMKPI